MTGTTVTPETALQMLQQLPPREQLRVIAQALPGLERELTSSPRARRSFIGICADLGPAPSAEEIDEVRREMWANFPRDDI